MKFKDKYNINKDFENLFSFQDERDELDHEAHMLMFRFLSEAEKSEAAGNNLRKRDIASKLGVSPSYITQLFNFPFTFKLWESQFWQICFLFHTSKRC